MKIINDLSKKSAMALMAGALTLGAGAFAAKNSTKAQIKNEITTTNPLTTTPTDNQKTVSAYQAYAGVNATKSAVKDLDTDEKIVKAFNNLTKEEKALIPEVVNNIFNDKVEDLKQKSLSSIFPKYKIFSETYGFGKEGDQDRGRYLISSDIIEVADHGKARERQLAKAREELVNLWRDPKTPEIKIPKDDFYEFVKNVYYANRPLDDYGCIKKDKEKSAMEYLLLYNGYGFAQLEHYYNPIIPDFEGDRDSLYLTAIKDGRIELPKTFDDLRNNYTSEIAAIRDSAHAGDGVTKYIDWSAGGMYTTETLGRLYTNNDVANITGRKKVFIFGALDRIDDYMAKLGTQYTIQRLGRSGEAQRAEDFGIGYPAQYYRDFNPTSVDFGKAAMSKISLENVDTLETIPDDMGWIQKEALREAIPQTKELNELRKKYLQLTEAGRKKLIEIIFPYGNDRITNDDVFAKYIELNRTQQKEYQKLKEELRKLYDGSDYYRGKDWFDGYFPTPDDVNIFDWIDDVPGNDYVDVIRDKVRVISILYYNYANNTINEIKDPNNTDSIKVDKYDLFEIAAQDTLGCSSEEFQTKYAAELKEITNMQSQAKSRSVTNSEGLSDAAKEVLKKLGALRTKVINLYASDVNFESSPLLVYDNMIHFAIMKAWDDEGDTKIINNNYENPTEFRLPKSWIVREVYKKALQEVLNEEGIIGINDIKTEGKNAPKTKKFLQNGQVIIERTNADGSKAQYSTSGERIK